MLVIQGFYLEEHYNLFQIGEWQSYSDDPIAEAAVSERILWPVDELDESATLPATEVEESDLSYLFYGGLLGACRTLGDRGAGVGERCQFFENMRRIASYLTRIFGKVAPLSCFCGRFIQSPTDS